MIMKVIQYLCKTGIDITRDATHTNHVILNQVVEVNPFIPVVAVRLKFTVGFLKNMILI